MIPSYSMILAIWWSQAIRWSLAIRWSSGSMDFDNPTVYSDTFISDGLVKSSFCVLELKETGFPQYISMVLLGGLVSCNPNTQKLTLKETNKRFSLSTYDYLCPFCIFCIFSAQSLLKMVKYIKRIFGEFFTSHIQLVLNIFITSCLFLIELLLFLL